MLENTIIFGIIVCPTMLLLCGVMALLEKTQLFDKIMINVFDLEEE